MKTMRKDKLWTWLLFGALLLAFTASFCLLYFHALPALSNIAGFIGVLILPFILAWLTAVITRPAVAFLCDVLRLPRSFAVLVLMFFFILLLALLVMLLISVVGDVLWNVSDYVRQMKDYPQRLTDYMDNLAASLNLDPALINRYLDSWKDNIGQWASAALLFIFNVVKGTPTAFLVLLVSVAAIFYWCRDEEKIKTLLAGLLPSKRRCAFIYAYESFSAMAGGYIRAQMLLVIISTAICIFGFMLAGADNPIAMGLLAGILDMIPVLGPGTLILPWAAWKLLIGDTGMALGLAAVYLVTTVCRNILEPKLVGDRLGLHPLAALAALFVGMKIFGIAGVIIGPLGMAVLISWYRRRKNAEEPQEKNKKTSDLPSSREPFPNGAASIIDKKKNGYSKK